MSDSASVQSIREFPVAQAASSERQSFVGERFLPMPGILGESPAMREVFRCMGRLSRSSFSVLINGETGTGKELAARALHCHSPELLAAENRPPEAEWQQALREWALAELSTGRDGVGREVLAVAERLMIEAALQATHGKRCVAAKRLGFGRNTLTRKIKEPEGRGGGFPHLARHQRMLKANHHRAGRTP